LPLDDGRGAKPVTITERFFNLEMIPVADIIQFPVNLPELLKAA
jgi:hypothetical protein